LKVISTTGHAREGGHPGIKHLIQIIWIPASAGMTKDAVHPRFGKPGILAYFRKHWREIEAYGWIRILF
jgi:hypothetical protein